MAKKQTRRSISVSRTTYERLKAFCETNHISMSQLVETRVNDFLGPSEAGGVALAAAGGAGGGGAGAGGARPPPPPPARPRGPGRGAGHPARPPAPPP